MMFKTCFHVYTRHYNTCFVVFELLTHVDDTIIAAVSTFHFPLAQHNKGPSISYWGHSPKLCTSFVT